MKFYDDRDRDSKIAEVKVKAKGKAKKTTTTVTTTVKNEEGEDEERESERVEIERKIKKVKYTITEMKGEDEPVNLMTLTNLLIPISLLSLLTPLTLSAQDRAGRQAQQKCVQAQMDWRCFQGRDRKQVRLCLTSF